MRFGLVGTGYWAVETYAPGLSTSREGRLTCVWGRDPHKTRSVAKRFGVASCDSFNDLLDRVDAVAFAVPPEIQAPLAERAAESGKHLLLEKPVATSPEAASRLAAQVDASAVASVVFFTNRFRPERRAWIEHVTAQGGWHGAVAMWLTSALLAGSPYEHSTWRQERGALWDVGPHALSILCPIMGEVTEVRATIAGEGSTWIILQHVSGAISSGILSLHTPPAASRMGLLYVWGDNGRSTMPEKPSPPVNALRLAADELVDAATSGRRHPCDVSFGRHITDILARAESMASPQVSKWPRDL